MLNFYHDSVFFFAGKITLVDVLVAVGFVVFGQWFAFEFAQLVQGT
jgi:hypothetical protein